LRGAIVKLCIIRSTNTRVHDATCPREHVDIDALTSLLRLARNWADDNCLSLQSSELELLTLFGVEHPRTP
jgi:hypothetical protein